MIRWKSFPWKTSRTVWWSKKNVYRLVWSGMIYTVVECDRWCLRALFWAGNATVDLKGEVMRLFEYLDRFGYPEDVRRQLGIPGKSSISDRRYASGILRQHSWKWTSMSAFWFHVVEQDWSDTDRSGNITCDRDRNRKLSYFCGWVCWFDIAVNISRCKTQSVSVMPPWVLSFIWKDQWMRLCQNSQSTSEKRGGACRWEVCGSEKPRRCIE